jgi:hypothetical protein
MSRSVIVYNGNEVGIPSMDGMLNLTALWKAVGSPERKRPVDCMATQSSIEYIEDTSVKLKVAKNHLYRVTKGRYGATWAIWEIAGAYAEYLDHDLHREILNVYRKVKEDALIRHNRIEARKEYGAVLASHGVSGSGFGICTDIGYRSYFGAPAKQLKERYSVKGSLRDAMRPSAQAAVTLYETLAAEEIEEFDLRGTPLCADATGRNAHHVKDAVLAARRSRQAQIPLK